MVDMGLLDITSLICSKCHCCKRVSCPQMEGGVSLRTPSLVVKSITKNASMIYCHMYIGPYLVGGPVIGVK
jgi:hypothetical protein